MPDIMTHNDTGWLECFWMSNVFTFFKKIVFSINKNPPYSIDVNIQFYDNYIDYTSDYISIEAFDFTKSYSLAYKYVSNNNLEKNHWNSVEIIVR